ncbi:MAG: carboxypeptidase regulatory-like domain-containing protein, partial [Vicinamibacterales bacterium]
MWNTRSWQCGLLVLLLILCGGGAASAQNPTFALEGVVADAQQAVLPGATVTVQNVSTGLVRVATTDSSGRFVITAMPTEGRYRVQVDLAGFATEVREDLIFNAGQRAVLNFALRLSTVQETVTVAGVSPLIQTTSAEVTSTVDRNAFENLPVKERNYFRLLTLDSNVVATGTGSNAVNVGGQEVWNFGTYVDGTNNHSKWLTLQRAPQLGSSGFAIETVKEVQLITNQFSAEFGGHSAGVASMITKSGTNAVNGSTFVMIRPGDWDAAPPLAPIVNGKKTKAPYNQQQFGAMIGGPLVRDRVFYFGSYERRRERSSVTVTSLEAFGRIVPTPADEHQGHFKG